MRLALTLAALAAGPALAQPDPEPKDGRVTVPLLLSPAAPPVPASRYHVYPEYRDQVPGSRVQGLLRCFAERNKFYGADSLERDKLAELPLAELPADAREKAGIHSGLAYPQSNTQTANIDAAARLSRVEWNEYFDLRRNGFRYLIPDVQQMRQLAGVVSLRMRAEVKAGEWHRAVESAKTLFGIAQALEQHPTIIGNLVGIAIAQVALSRLEEFVAQPGAPSLFWALADLPAPLVSKRAGLAGERVMLSDMFRPLLTARGPVSDADLEQMLGHVRDIAQVMDKPKGGVLDPTALVGKYPKTYFAGMVADPGRKAAARARAVTHGFDGAVYDALPAAQQGLLDELHHYAETRDELFKWANLPAWQRSGASIDADGAKRAPGRIFAPALVPALFAAGEAETRLTMRAALLRVVEAVRLHAQQAGELPATLDAVKLPLPVDPFTNKPFRYEVRDGAAVVGSEYKLAGGERVNRWYELRLRK